MILSSRAFTLVKLSHKYSSNFGEKLSHKLKTDVHIIVPNLSKYLKFLAIGGIRVINLTEFEQRDITRPARVLSSQNGAP